MRLKPLLAISIYFCIPHLLQAQTPIARQVAGIHKIYQTVRSSISRQTFHHNQFTFNVKRHNLHQSGYRHYSQKLYYSVQGSQVHLRLALVKSERANIDYQKEFLFNEKGELIYFHEKQNDEQKHPYREVKVYFEQGKLLVWNQNKQSHLQPQFVQSPDEKIKAIIQESKVLQEDLRKQVEE